MSVSDNQEKTRRIDMTKDIAVTGVAIDNEKTVVALTGNVTDNDITVKPSKDNRDSDVSGNDFLLKGDVYKNVKCISNSSGEAQVYLVERDGVQYVLKVYYPNFKLNRDIIKIVSNMSFEMIMKVYDYGSTYVEGKKRDFELMEYLKGGTLNHYDVQGDFNKFRRIALQCAGALEYIHRRGIIHKDIKPGNFFFRDEEQTEVVLGDFGISSPYDADKTMVAKTTQARTPAFAAPDMYSNVIDGEVEISPSVDFYSLGITLMVIWLGKKALDSNERTMMRMKMEGQLAHINDLPEKVRSIVQGLTTVNPSKRWGYDEVERWFKGEDVKVDLSSPFLRYNSFVIDPDKNLLAQTPKQLASLFYENKSLGITYLYNHKVDQWLESSGNDKLALKIREIVTDIYPADSNAGLMASIYILDPEFPYIDIKGNQCTNLHAICISLVSNMQEYGLLLRNPNDDVFLYLQSHTDCNIERMRNYFKRTKENASHRISILRMVYEFDPDVPFLAKYPSSTLIEIVHSFGYEDVTEDDWISICDGRLLSWMYCHSDRMECETVRIMTEGQKPSKTLAYKVMYNIDRNVAFDLREADTPEKVAELMNEKLLACQHLSTEEFKKEMDDYVNTDGILFYYAQMHGWYSEVSEGKRRFNFNSEENRERMGAYDIQTAAYSFCKILGRVPDYQINNMLIVNDESQLDKRYVADIRNEIKHGNFAQWLSIFYHENPDASFDELYSYEKTLESWLLRLGDYDATQKYYRRYISAQDETKKQLESARSLWNHASSKEKVWNMVFYGLCVFWLILIIFVGITDHGRQYLVDHTVFSIGVPLGLSTALICIVHAYFKGWGFTLCLFAAVAGFVSSAIPIMILREIYKNVPSLFTPMLVLISVVYIIICNLTNYRRNSDDEKAAINEVLEDDIKSTLLEPLYYTFKMRSYKYKGTKFAMLQDVSDHVRSMAGECVVHYISWSILVMVLILDFIIYSPSFMNTPNPKLPTWRVDYQEVLHSLKKSIE